MIVLWILGGVVAINAVALMPKPGRVRDDAEPAPLRRRRRGRKAELVRAPLLSASSN